MFSPELLWELIFNQEFCSICGGLLDITGIGEKASIPECCNCGNSFKSRFKDPQENINVN